MAEAAFEAEDTIIFHVFHQLYMRYQGETSDEDFLAFCETMEGVIQKICFIKNVVLAIKEEGEVLQDGKQLSAFSVPAASSSIASTRGQDLIVGTDEHVFRIVDMLTRCTSAKLQILPIVGMGGIGKTTLAKNVFDHPHIVNYFDVCIWLTISQEYSVKHILTGLLDEGGNKKSCESSVELGDRLYKKLFGKRYLIVMDDIWTNEAWNELKCFLPENDSGSCIMLTTRLKDMASPLGSHNPYPLAFLDKDKSWDLFCSNAFGQIDCPYQHLERVAKDIARNCRGLPLEIVVIGRLLANSNMTVECWEEVAKNISSFVNSEDDDHCLKILSLSYRSLPIHLKLCFLYTCVFREDSWISIKSLVDNWIAQGFVKPVNHKCLEETAQEYFKCLMDRNLIFHRDDIHCGVHDLLRDFGLREFDNEQFTESPKEQSVELDYDFQMGPHCFLCGYNKATYKETRNNERIHFPKLGHISTSSSQISDLVCDACKMGYSPTLVRTIIEAFQDGFSSEILQPVTMRLLHLYVLPQEGFAFHSKLHLLWNLQSIIIYYDDLLFCSHVISFPPEIWEMPQLRHISCKDGLYLPDPVASHTDGEDFLVLNNLETLCVVIDFEYTKEILDRIPNLKELMIFQTFQTEASSMREMERLNYSLYNLYQLQKLESLKVIGGALQKITFPNSLKKLSLRHFSMTWEGMSIIGTLPSLEKLNLEYGIEGLEWNPAEEEFLQLKELNIADVYLVCWRAHPTQFPCLERLTLTRLKSLEEIPLGIGDIPTLQSITTESCSNSAVNSAKKIWEEQHSLENDIRIHIYDEYGFSYQIGPFTATMSRTACASLALLKHILPSPLRIVPLEDCRSTRP